MVEIALHSNRWENSASGDYHRRLQRLSVLRSGWHRVQANGGSAGGDRVTVNDFAHDAEDELVILSRDLAIDIYRPGPVRRVPISKKSGDVRWLSIPCVRDRVVQSALHQILSPALEKEFEPESFGYRPGRGHRDAVALAERWLGEGFEYVVDADIESFFDSVPHNRLSDKLIAATADPDLVRLVERWLRAADADSDAKGLPQGAPISPLLANLYLDDLDETFRQRGIRLVRFADDFVILCRSRKRAREVLDDLTDFLREDGLTLHPEKTRIRSHGDGFRFLGQVLVKAAARAQTADDAEPLAALQDLRDAVLDDEIDTAATRPAREPRPLVPKVRTAPGLRPLYIYGDDRRLTTRNQSFTVQEDGRDALVVHHSRVDRIELGPDADIDAEALRLAAENAIPVALVTAGGTPLATCAPGTLRWGRRQMAQAATALDPGRRLHIACAIAWARLHNQKDLLYRLNRPRRTKASRPEVKDAARRIGRIARKLSRAKSVEEVLGIEGEAGKLYWPAYGACLMHDFTLPLRGRRDRASPAAVLLDFASALLAREVEALVHKAGLHPAFGILHTSRRDGSPCAWDLMEPYRAPLAESVTAQALNNEEVRRSDLERDADGAFRLRPTGRDNFIRTWERALEGPVEDPRSGNKVSWRVLIRNDIYQFAHAAELGRPYTPYLMNWKRTGRHDGI